MHAPTQMRRRASSAQRWQAAGLSILALVPGLTAFAAPADVHRREIGPALTVTEAIETTRFMTDADNQAVFVSPGGQRYAIMLITGDVSRDGVWMELKVGECATLASARPRLLVRLFSRGLGAGYAKRFGADQLTTPGSNVPVWLGDEALAYFWEDAHGVRQIMAVDVATGRVRSLTQHATPVIQFSVSPIGDLIYNAAIARDLKRVEARQRDGYAVTERDATELLSGGVRGVWDWMMHERFVVTALQPTARRIQFEGGDAVGRFLPVRAPVYSPDGRFAITAHSVSAGQIPASWSRYTFEHFRSMWRARQDHPDGLFARQFQQYFVVDVEQATARPLWQVPVVPDGRTVMTWSPDVRSVAIGPTFLPVNGADADALAAGAIAVVEVGSGAFERLPMPAAQARALSALRWTGPDAVEARLSDDSRHNWRRTSEGWALAPGAPMPIYRSETARTEPEKALVRVEVRQALNTPPALYGVERSTGRAVQLLDPTPQLRQRRLGRVEWLSERKSDGNAWEGRLYYPLHYRAGQHYPLVVQTYAFTPRDAFSLYGYAGPALGPGRSAYIAQSLATRDVFVLHGPSRADSLKDLSRTLDELEAQVQSLITRGLVDRTRVGIMGFSASGWLTTYALTRGGFPYAAALTDDNKDGSYFQAGLSNWDYGVGEYMIGAAPFGEGLKAWIAHSPAMNVERIHTPLLITRSSPAMPLNGWELFSRLRYLRKPVEYYFIPDVEHGSHGLQNPRQLRALQQRALDWWCYWLKGERDPDPAKAGEYERWDELRRRHENDLRTRDASPNAS